MQRVPQQSKGASRRAYHHGYGKGATNKVSRLLGDRKLRTPKFETAKSGAGRAAREAEPETPRMRISFGRTGLTGSEDFDV